MLHAERTGYRGAQGYVSRERTLSGQELIVRKVAAHDMLADTQTDALSRESGLMTGDEVRI